MCIMWMLFLHDISLLVEVFIRIIMLASDINSKKSFGRLESEAFVGIRTILEVSWKLCYDSLLCNFHLEDEFVINLSFLGVSER